ncbi:MAG: hypothetical protein WCJ24_02750 [Candidatus Saccharibacteria bacterium]
MAAAATQEQTDIWLTPELAFPELYQNAEIRTAQYLGSMVMQNEVIIEPVERDYSQSTLLAALQTASLGDESSLRMVKTNVSTDVAERLFKVASQTRVELEVTSQGFTQEGRKLTDVLTNTLQHTILNAEMHGRTAGQLKNGFVFEELLRAGVLDTHDALVCEPCPTDEKTRKDYNFFTDTDSMSMQLLRVDGDEAVLETALVAGKKTPQSPRHDMETIQALASQKGLDLIPADVNGTVQYIMLIPKQTVPNFVEDVVAEYDQIAGTFYGQAKPRRDYNQYADECYQRNQSFNDVVEQITTQLVAEAHIFETPLEAIERLDNLSERYCVKRAQNDHRIDAIVFGPQAAAFIDQARLFIEQGDEVKASQSIVQAQKTAVSGSCPLFKNSSVSPDDSTIDNSSDNSEGKSKLKWMSCPHCDARVFADPCASVLKCWDCKAKVVNGITFKGDGGSKQRKAEKSKAKAQLTTV